MRLGLTFVIFLQALASCRPSGEIQVQRIGSETGEAVDTSEDDQGPTDGKNEEEKSSTSPGSLKLTADNCVDPDLSRLEAGIKLMLCDGTIAEGTLVLVGGSPTSCSSDGAVGCLANTSFPAAQKAGLAAKVKNGETVAGETGTYPSAGNLLAGADGTADLSDNAGTRQAQLKSSATFEWFLPDGTRATGTGDADIAAANIVTGTNIFGEAGSASTASPDAWDVRYGVTVGSTTGRLKVNCRNMVDASTWDNSGGLAGVGSDVFDTIDDYNNNGTYPSTNPWSGADNNKYLCGFNGTDPNWERVATTPVTSGVNSVFNDKISGLQWTRGDSTAIKDWDEVAGGAGNGALEYCDNLDHGGIDAWRLPTQKELMAAYSNGIYDLDDDNTATDNLGELHGYFWSSSTQSNVGSFAWNMYVSLGITGTDLKTVSHSVLCVSP